MIIMKIFESLTPYVDYVTSYIAAGFIVKKLKSKINCKICRTYFVDQSGHISSLILIKDRNVLITI